MSGWLVPALLAWASMGICNLFAKLASDRLPLLSINIWWAVGYAPMTFVLVPFIPQKLDYHRRSAILNFIAGILGPAANLTFLAALSMGLVSVVSAIAYMFPLVTLILAVAFFKERINRRQLVGIAFALAAIYLFSV